MKKLKTGIEILKYLSSQNKPVSIDAIAKYLNTSFELEKEIKARSIKEYLRELSNELVYTGGGIQQPIIESKRGIDGGWMITKSGREEMKSWSFDSFKSDTLNAINDSFQRAMVSETFHYKKDLKKAKGILYLTKNFHEHDHEHYLGNSNEIIESGIVKKLKEVALADQYALITFKFIRYSIEEKQMKLKVIRLIHDLDESFVICSKPDSDEPMYINIRNIEKIRKLDQRFIRKYESKYSSNVNEGKTSIAVRSEQWVKLRIHNELMYEVIELWIHGCSFEFSDDRKEVLVKSYEHYKLMLFLFRTIGCATVIDAHEMIKRRWNEKVDSIKKISE
ncbi:WYL domain-containing protein [Mycoplasma todarodis]|uniref:WYL domain-containing protein n=1 Tax=Mycoplasma todarodis TaxID=1937191 RepID=UPI003B2BDE3B